MVGGVEVLLKVNKNHIISFLNVPLSVSLALKKNFFPKMHII